MLLMNLIELKKKRIAKKKKKKKNRIEKIIKGNGDKLC